MSNLQNNIKNRTIFCRDNIDILQGINSNSIDLIYLDPPFNKNKIFTAPIGSSAEGASFRDYFREEDLKNDWVQTIKEDNIELYNFLSGVKTISSNKYYLYNYCYLSYMAIRLIEMQRILKDTGSIYLHCDPTMSHYIKLLLDIIFGEKNFRNEIVWNYTGPSNTKQYYPRKHDILFFYVKSNNNYFFNNDNIKIPYTRLETGKTSGIFKSAATLDKTGKIPEDWWEEKRDGMTPVGRLQSERTGYPTQKPLALLTRIIKASSNEGNTVLDPFCGCATTCVASEKLNRKWIGIDVSVKAYDLVKERLQKEVADPENLLQYQNKVQYSTTPPRRTDNNADNSVLKKYVYVISHPNYKGEYKVGIAKDYKARLNSYQTSDPDRNYKLEYKNHTHLFREIEKYIHEKFENKHEWVRVKLKNIIDEIENYSN